MNLSYNISPLGDNALLIHFGNRIDEAVNRHVLAVFKRIKAAGLPIIDLVPSYASLAVYYDVLSLYTKEQTAYEKMQQLIEPLLLHTVDEGYLTARHWKIPVCYSKKFGLDIDELSRQKKIAVEELISLHTATTYRVYTIGFLPGFAYMGKVAEHLAMPRRVQPRTNVPAGSVGIAGEQTGIYPLASPGGWNIIGRTPWQLFDLMKEEPVLLEPGDEVNFYSITDDEFENYQGGNS